MNEKVTDLDIMRSLSEEIVILRALNAELLAALDPISFDWLINELVRHSGESESITHIQIFRRKAKAQRVVMAKAKELDQ